MSERSRASSVGATQISASLSIIAAMALATLVNIYVARHYRRWDWTRGGLYTLSEATVATLRNLHEPLRIYVLLSSGDPLAISIQHLLEIYCGETSQLTIELVDPDRRPADFLGLAQRYGIDVDRDEGHALADAAAIVVRGDRRELILRQELVEVDADDELKRRPRLEQAFTSALRAVTASDHPAACFTVGHGESPSLPLRDHLRRNGYQVESIEPARAGESGGVLDTCKVLVLAGPTERVAGADVARFKAYAEKGGNVLVAVGPQGDSGDGGYRNLGIGELLGVFGIKLDADFVFELDARVRAANGHGETFVPSPRPHPVTQSLMRVVAKGVVPVVTVASSLSITGVGGAAPVSILVTSEQAFGMSDFFGWAKTGSTPVPGAGDKKGPLTIAVAAELPAASGAAHGGRMVAVGSAGVLDGANWQNEDLRGTALFVESAVAWLASRPPILDIPRKPAFTAGLRVSDDKMAGIFRYVVVYMPAATMLWGLAVYLRRRSDKRITPGAKGEG